MHAVFAEQIHVPGHQQRSAVNQRNEPDADWLDDTSESVFWNCGALRHALPISSRGAIRENFAINHAQSFSIDV